MKHETVSLHIQLFNFLTYHQCVARWLFIVVVVVFDLFSSFSGHGNRNVLPSATATRKVASLVRTILRCRGRKKYRNMYAAHNIIRMEATKENLFYSAHY